MRFLGVSSDRFEGVEERERGSGYGKEDGEVICFGKGPPVGEFGQYHTFIITNIIIFWLAFSVLKKPFLGPSLVSKSKREAKRV